MIISGCRSHVAAQQSFCGKHDTIPVHSNCCQQLARVHFPPTHPQPQERNYRFQGYGLNSQGVFIPCCSKFRGSSLIFHWVSLHDYLPQKASPWVLHLFSVCLSARQVCFSNTVIQSHIVLLRKTPDLLKIFHWIISQRPIHCLT